MKDGNESGKDGGLVCTGIVREGRRHNERQSFQTQLSQSRLTYSRETRMAFVKDALATCANGLFGERR